MTQKLIRCSCNSSAFIHNLNNDNNLVAIVNILKDKDKTNNNIWNSVDVYCLDCNKKYTVKENKLIVKYISKTIENYVNEV